MLRNTRSLMICALGILRAAAVGAHPWPTGPDTTTLEERVPAPPQCERLPAAEGSFSAWLRTLPVKPGRPPVLLHDGREKSRQDVHHVVLDIDVGRRDLQQCADAAMRLRAEYLRQAGQEEAICFRFTSGDPLWWHAWRQGMRPRVKKRRVELKGMAAPDASYASFRRYLDRVYTYAGSHSLSRELQPVSDPRRVEAGDLFIQGGFPGHAVMVVDVAENPAGERFFLLAQSYMPAQQIHVLRRPESARPWYRASARGPLVTPEWRFSYTDLKRFSDHGCPEPP